MKKILSILILFLPSNFAFSQITCVDSETIFSKLGTEFSYCTVSLGKDGVCSKYKVTIYEKNSSNQTISIEGAQLYIDPQIGMFPAAGTCGKREEYAGSDGIIWIEFPWVNANGLKTEIPPNSSFQKSFIVYTNGKYPQIGYRGVIYARPLNDKSSSNNNNNNNSSSNRGKSTSNSGGNNNSNSQSGSNAQSNSENNSVSQTNDEIANFNQYFTQLPSNDNTTIQLKNEAGAIINNNSLSDSQRATKLKSLTQRAKKRSEELGIENDTNTKQETAKQANEEKAARKAAEDAQRVAEENNRNNIAMVDKGIAAYNDGKYNDAIGYYNQALGMQGMTDARRTYVYDLIAKAQKALKDEASRKRVEEKQKQEAATNTATTAGITAVAGLMALLKDNYTDKPFAGRYYIGLGMERFIVNVNDFTNQQSEIKSAAPVSFIGGLHFTLFNNKNVNWVINPHGRFNQIFLDTGSSGSGYGLGVNTHLSFGLNKESPLRLFGEYQYNQNSLEYGYDDDVANSRKSSFTDAVYNGTYALTSSRIGGGIILRMGDRYDGETYFKPGYFIETIPALGIKRNMFTFEANIVSQIVVEFSYSGNYVSMGAVNFPQSSNMMSAIKEPSGSNYWSFKIIRRGLF